MPAPFLLDTNAYYLFFDPNRPPAYHRLATKVTTGGVKSFYIPEITSLEIHSVVGRYARGSQSQKQACTRDISKGEGVAKCSNLWVSPGRRKMTRGLVRDIRKMIEDIEAPRGLIQATVVRLDSTAIEWGRQLLLKYGHRFSFSSHDALIGGTLLGARQTIGTQIVLVSSDKGLKAALAEEGLSVYDPRNE